MIITEATGWLSAAVLVLVNIGLLLAFLLVRARRASHQGRVAALEVELERLKNREFVLARYSTDLRSLVTALSGLSEILTDPQPPSDYRRKLQAFHATASDLHNSTVNLHSQLSGMEGLKSEPTLPVDLRECMSLLRHEAYAAAASRGLELEIVHTPYSPVQVLTQPALIQRALFNVVRHAIAFAQPGTVEIAILEGKGEHQICISITCPSVRTGRRASDNLFEPFGLENSNGLIYPPGTGLCLSTAAHIISGMGGELTARSDRATGTQFELLLPAEILSIDDGAVAANDRVVSINDPYVKHRRKVAPLQILVCDEQANTRVMVAAALEKAGHEVRQATSAVQALEMLEEQPFGLLIVDAHLSDMPGADLVRRIGARPDIPRGRLRTLILSSDVSRAGREEAYRAGAGAYLNKPLSTRRLLEAVEDLCEARLINPSELTDPDGDLRPTAAMVAAIDDLVVYRNQLRKAVGENDWDEVVEQVRAIRGAAISANAPAVIELCGRLLNASAHTMRADAVSICREISFEIDVATRARGVLKRSEHQED